MQPYLFPYIGYFQLISSVDIFVIYDNIEYTKKGWINRNRFLMNGKAEYFTVPLKKESDYLTVINRNLSDDKLKKIKKILNQIESTYRKAPYFKEVLPVIKSIFINEETNLFKYIYFSLRTILDFLNIETKIIVASEININHSLKSQEKVLAICEALNATKYINTIGGTELYSKESFEDKNIKLSFIQSNSIIYNQFDEPFVPWLSIIDVMMFNSKETILNYLKDNTLIE